MTYDDPPWRPVVARGHVSSLKTMATDVNEVLRQLHSSFRTSLNFQSISPHLRSHYLLTTHEWEIISKKDSREDQADEFLKCLPHKGKGCLERLLDCLQLSLDHSGHQDLITELSKHIITDVAQSKIDHLKSQDEFERAVNTINIAYSNQKETVAMLMEKLNRQEDKIKQLELTCSNQNTTIQQLSDTVSNQKAEIVSLDSKLQEKEKLINTWSHSIMNGHSYETESYKMSSCSSHDSVVSNDNFECGPPITKANDSNECSDTVQQLRLSPNMHSELSKKLSIEDKMKIYHTNLASFHKKCLQLEEEKAMLKESKHQLEQEVVRLREELEEVSLKSSISTSISSINFQISMPVVLSDDMYLNPLHQGWLTKEGGLKKSCKRRWCMLSSRFFFYFEDENVQLKGQKPIGILPLTKDMEVTDCKRENKFEVHEKSMANMKSCKLDKNRGVYIPGNHAVYNLQAPSDGDRKKWIKAFQTVFESLKHSN